jgi:hypothetical protein
MTHSAYAGKSTSTPKLELWRLFGAAFVSVAISSVASGQADVQRDQQALAILKQTVAAGGGQDMLATIQDLTATGTATYYSDDLLTGSVTIKCRGLHQFKLEADLSIGKRVLVVNGYGGSLRDENSGTWAIRRQRAIDLGSAILPYLPLIAALEDPSISITYRGLVSHNGGPAYDIRFEKMYTPQQDPSGNRGALEAHDVFIDPRSWLVVSRLDQLHHGSGGDEGIAHETLYSNYQVISSIVMPLAISETEEGTTGVTIQLTQVVFNSGLSDSDFNW